MKLEKGVLTEMVRSILNDNINLDAKEVCQKMLKKHNLTVTPQQVYNIRSQLKIKRTASAKNGQLTRRENKLSLNDAVLTVLKSNDGLSDRQIAEKVKDLGYVSRSDYFFELVRVRLLVEEGLVIKQNTNYWIKPEKVGFIQKAGRGERKSLPKTENSLEILLEVSALLEKVGGEEALKTYVETLRKLK